MSTNYLVNVPKLKGRENYDDWCFAAENVLVLEGMADNIKRPLPATAKEAQIAEDLKAKAKLILTIDASLYVHIKQATTTYSLWQILKNMFDDSGYARKISLLRNLISIRLENCESMTSYVSQIIETAHKLNGTGFEINDQWIGSLMLAGLPEKFSPMIMAIEHSGINISADAIKTKLLDMSADFEGKSEGAFAAKKFHRRNVGSTARTQVQQHGNSATNGMYGSSPVTVNTSGQAQTSRKKIIRCYKCKQTGHFKNQCQVADKAKSNAFSAVFLTKEFSQSDWHLDSGASTHIVSNVNLLTNVCNRPKTKEIIVANQTVVPVSCSGDLQLTTCVGDNEFTIDVKDVLCVPNLTTNLLSVSRIIASGKQTRLPFPTSTSKSRNTLELVHTDLCGPMENVSLGKAKYYLLFVDDFSRMCTVYFLKCKSETFKYFKQYKELVENQQSKKIKILRSDNGGEFCSTEMTNFLKQSGIVHQKTNSFTPEQNGLSERYNRTIVEKARCLLYDAKFEKFLWAEAVNTAVYLKNRSPAAGLDGSKTPYEIWTGRKPELNHIRIFGSPTMVHIPKEKRRKWDKKAKKMYLVGYSENVKGYRLYDPILRDVIVGRDVVIMEKTDDSLSSSIGIEENRPLDTSAEKVPENDSDEENQHDETYVPDVASDSEDSFEDTMTLSPEAEDIISQESVESLPEKRVRRKPDFYQSANMCVEMLDEHISLSDAMNGSEKDQWQSAMQQELESFRDNDSWELVDRPSEGTIVKNKWVFKKKHNTEGEVRYRARLVAKGFTQKRA
ncbi:Retrovirus-related Pol polyprotein from transposon TNT 1-94 [Eumeta japonica]|uniref:Retrovirus-related Pol polyprotein from transposon TNT 1-94 n=1 Tax=Eumeta variegata TaxID=151549 RepID=A0A4C1SW94_EUMVA|nr:Retrovirus-related Pol polyprotein from transposon TNT 1-94 [Eumeta japonica]